MPALICLVVPGLYFLFACLLVTPLIVLEDYSGWDACTESHARLRGSRVATFAIVLLAVIVLAIALLAIDGALIAGLLAAGIPVAPHSAGARYLGAGVIVVGHLLMTPSLSLVYVLYAKLTEARRRSFG